MRYGAAISSGTPGRGSDYRLLGVGVLLAVVAGACEREPPEEMVQEMEALEAERTELEQRVQELEERADVVDEIRTGVDDMDLPEAVREELEEDPPGTAYDSVMVVVEGIQEQAEGLWSQLQGARGEAATLRQRVDSIQVAMEEAEVDWEGRVAAEEERASDLEGQVQALQGERDQLQGDVADLEGRVAALQSEIHEVFYVAGTRQELIDQGIIDEEGGARVILGLFWKRGEALVPSREFDPAAFEQLDRREADEIVLPRDDVRYQVVSRQDVGYMEPTPGNDRVVEGGAIRITDPEAFWRNSRFLILMEEE